MILGERKLLVQGELRFMVKKEGVKRQESRDDGRGWMCDGGCVMYEGREAGGGRWESRGEGLSSLFYQELENVIGSANGLKIYQKSISER